MDVVKLGWILRFFKWLKWFFCDTRNPIVQVPARSRLPARACMSR